MLTVNDKVVCCASSSSHLCNIIAIHDDQIELQMVLCGTFITETADCNTGIGDNVTIILYQEFDNAHKIGTWIESNVPDLIVYVDVMGATIHFVAKLQAELFGGLNTNALAQAFVTGIRKMTKSDVDGYMHDEYVGGDSVRDTNNKILTKLKQHFNIK